MDELLQNILDITPNLLWNNFKFNCTLYVIILQKCRYFINYRFQQTTLYFITYSRRPTRFEYTGVTLLISVFICNILGNICPPEDTTNWERPNKGEILPAA